MKKSFEAYQPIFHSNKSNKRAKSFFFDAWQLKNRFIKKGMTDSWVHLRVLKIKIKKLNEIYLEGM